VCVCVCFFLYKNLCELNFSPHSSYFTWSSAWTGCCSCLCIYLQHCCASCFI